MNRGSEVVYVHNHFRYFKNTLRRINTKASVNNAIIQVADNVVKNINIIKEPIVKEEENFLKLVFPQGGTRDDYRKIYANQIDKVENDIVKSFIETKEEITTEEIRKYFKVENLQPGQKKEFIQSRLKKLRDTYKQMAKLINKLLNMYGDLSDTKSNINVDYLKKAKKGVDEALALLEKEGKGGFKDYGTLKKVNSLVKGLKRTISGNVYELLVAQVFVGADELMPNITADQVGKALKFDLKNGKASVEMVGYKGQSAAGQEKYKTTDIIFNIGNESIGVDVKSGKELYVKSFTKTGQISDSVQDVIGKERRLKSFSSVGINDTDLLSKVIYSFVNYKAFLQGANQVVAGADITVDTNLLRNEVFIPMQRIIMISILITFADDYVNNFNNSYRKQLIIANPEKVLFLTEFLDYISKIIMQYAAQTGKYDMGGFSDIDTTSVSFSENDLSDLWLKKKDVLGDLQGTRGGSYYYKLFMKNMNDMKRLTKEVLSASYKAKLLLNLNDV